MKKYGIKRWGLVMCAALLLGGCASQIGTAGETATAYGHDGAAQIAGMEEADVTPAELAGHTVRQLTTTARGELLLVTMDAQALPHAYRQQDGAWQEQDNTAVVQWMQENRAYNRNIYCDATGSWWAVVGDSVVQILPDGRTREIELPQEAASEPYVSVEGFADRGDGLVCFAAKQTAEKNGPDPGGVWYLVDSENGTVTQTESFIDRLDFEPVFYAGDLVIYDGIATTLKQYDAESGTLMAETPIERPETMPDAAAMSEDGVYHYFLNRTGLYRRPLEGDFTQTVTDDTGLQCLSDGFEAVGLCPCADGTYLVAGNLNGKIKLYQLSIGT